jgi:hypothetical protein
MNCFEQVRFIEQVIDDPAVDAVGKLVAAGLVRFVDKATGQCDPSVDALGQRIRRKAESVRKGFQSLAKAGHIEIQRRFNNTSVYTLKLKETSGKSTVRRVEKPLPPPTENRHLTEDKKESTKEPVGDVTARDIQWLIRRWQQMADKPGWKMANAVAAVIGAVKRVGFDAVAHLYAQLEAEGKRGAWWLERQLRDLRPVFVPTPAPTESTGSAKADVSRLDTLPVEALARLHDARLIVDDARTNPPLWVRVRAAIVTAGMAPFRMSEPHLVEKQLATALAQGHIV